MKKPVVILADLDESYLVTLELKFLQELNNKVDLEVITDRRYFDEYFTNFRKIDLLVVGEELYSSELSRHNIGSLYMLVEMLEQGGTENLSIQKIYKYTSIKEIFNELVSDGLSNLLEKEVVKKTTQVLAFYSPIGGVGVTTLAIGLAASLAESHKKVFFISTEALQNFQFYLENRGYLPNEACAVLKDATGHFCTELKPYIRYEEFYYLPPLYASLSALGLQFSVYQQLIEELRLSKDYDYIVVDLGTGFQEEKTGLLGLSDKVVVLLQQDAFSVHKMQSVMRNLELWDADKYLFLCNKFQKEKPNMIVGSELQKNINVSEYVEQMVELENAKSIGELKQCAGLQQLSYVFI